MKQLIAGAVLALLAAAAAAQDPVPKYAYTGLVDEPVITLDYQGSRVPRINAAPTLSIFADGRVEMPKNYAHMRAYSGRLSQPQLQQLLDLVVRKHGFFEYDQSRVQAKLGALRGPRNVLPEHLATTVISVTTNGQSKSIRHFALGHGPSIAETEQLLQVRDRLEQIMSVTRLGGEAEASRWLALANRELGDTHPGASPLGLEHLRSAAIHHDGSAHVRFARMAPQPDDSASVSISIDKAGSSHVTVAAGPALPTRSTDVQ